MPDTLFPAPRRSRGPAESAVARMLTDWRKAEHLTGDGNAAARRVLTDAAIALDRARAGVAAGDVSPYSLAMTARVLSELLAQHGPGRTSVDPWDALLSEHDDPATVRH